MLDILFIFIGGEISFYLADKYAIRRLYKINELHMYKDLQFYVGLEYYYDKELKEFYFDEELGNRNLKRIEEEYNLLKKNGI